MSTVILDLGTPPHTMPLVFEVESSSIAQRWLDQVRMFVAMGSQFDDRERFYNFPNTKFTAQYCRDQLWNLVRTIAPYVPEVQTLEPGPVSQDLLNQLHHVFEIYHGLYDQQINNTLFQRMDPAAQQAISDLNIWIHRIETLSQDPRFVVTWHRKPTRLPLTTDDFAQIDPVENFGDLQLNYCDIGKTLTCLWKDNDAYIGSDAFRPMQHFGFDFVVKFGNHATRHYLDQSHSIWQYYLAHEKYFAGLGFDKNHPAIKPGAIRIAKLLYTGNPDDLIDTIGHHARIHSVTVRD